jgi:histidine triad (HIT) family protein
MRENNDCIFCKVVNDEIPSFRILTNGKVIAFLDINPVNKGHALVIPKDHFKTLADIPENTLKDMMIAAKKISKCMRKALKADGINLGMNNSPAAGQEVMHAHLHVIPRFEGDGLEPWPAKKYDEGEMEQLREKLASLL